MIEDDVLLTPEEVAEQFLVSPVTVTRWAKAGKLASIKTPGGHYRFWMSEIKRLCEPEWATVIPNVEIELRDQGEL